VVVVPDIVTRIEVPRIISKIAVIGGITEENKLSILINAATRGVSEVISSAAEVGKCVEVSVWDRRYLRKAAGLYKRLSNVLGKRLKGKHQDLILLAVATLEEAIIVTTDADFRTFVEKGGLDTPLYYIEIDESVRTCRVHKANVKTETCVESPIQELQPLCEVRYA